MYGVAEVLDFDQEDLNLNHISTSYVDFEGHLTFFRLNVLICKTGIHNIGPDLEFLKSYEICKWNWFRSTV